jgi:hypothetical protein
MKIPFVASLKFFNSLINIINIDIGSYFNSCVGKVENRFWGSG